MTSSTVAIGSLVVSIVANGTFGVCHKLCTVPNEVFVVYHCIGTFFICTATMLLLPVLDLDIGFAPLALLSGLSQFFGLQFVFKTIELAGVALGTVGFAGSVITISLLWEIVSSGKPPDKPLLLGAALGLIALGLAGTSAAQQMSVLEERAYSAAQRTRATSADSPSAQEGLLFRTSSFFVSSEVPSRTRSQALLDSYVEAAASVAQEPHAPVETRSRAWGASKRRAKLVLLRLCTGLQLLGSIVGVGVCVVASNVLETYSPTPLQGLAYAWSFGVGMLAAMPLSPLIFLAVYRRAPQRSELGNRKDVGAGLGCGVIWGAAMIGMNMAIAGGMPEASALSFFQCSIFVAGLWGVWLRELVGFKLIVLFFAASVVFFGGILLESIANHPSHSSHHHSPTNSSANSSVTLS